MNLRKQDQLIAFTNGIGDCWRTCVANAVGFPVHNVPHFVELSVLHGTDYRILTKRWLAEIGYTFKKVKSNKVPEEGTYIVVVIREKEFTWSHAVLYVDGELYHDPQPFGPNIKSPIITGVYEIDEKKSGTKSKLLRKRKSNTRRSNRVGRRRSKHDA